MEVLFLLTYACNQAVGTVPHWHDFALSRSDLCARAPLGMWRDFLLQLRQQDCQCSFATAAAFVHVRLTVHMHWHAVAGVVGHALYVFATAHNSCMVLPKDELLLRG